SGQVMSDDGNQTCAIDDAAENRSRFRERLQHRSGLWFILVLAFDQPKDVRADISEPGLGGPRDLHKGLLRATVALRCLVDNPPHPGLSYRHPDGPGSREPGVMTSVTVTKADAQRY